MTQKSLYKDVQEEATNKVELVEDQEFDMKLFPESEDDEETIGFLDKRFDEMDSARPDDDWDIRWDQFESHIFWNDDNTAEINLPIEATTIRNKMADELSQRPLVTLHPTEKEDVNKVEFTKEIWDFVWNEGDTDKELFDLFLMKNIFGTAFWFEGLHEEIYTRFEPSVTKEGLVRSKAVTEKKSWLKGFALDIRDVYVDPVHDLEVAVDCFILERDVSEERLRQLENNPNYRNIDSALALGTSANEDRRAFLTDEERHDDDTRDKFVLYHYYNKEKGIYVVSVNKQVIIREGANPYAHGQLPISSIVDHKNPREIYGRGECELLESTKYERNEIRNQIIDLARRTNDTKMAIGDNLSFNDVGFIDDKTQVLSFEGDISQMQWIKQPTPDSGLFNVETMLRDDATWITGIDNNALAGSPQKTAFEARLQEQTKLKGISISLKLADFFYTRMARQRLANIQFWLPTTTGKNIVGNKRFRTIPIQDKRKEDINIVGKDNIAEIAGVRFETMEGNTEFLELTPKSIKSNLDITVETPSTTPILRELDRADLRELFNNAIQAAQISPEVLQEFNVRKVLEEQIKRLGKNPEDFLSKKEDVKVDQDIREEVLGDIPLPFKTMTQPERQELNPVLQNPLGMEQSA